MIWNTDANKRHILDIHTSIVRSISFSPDGSRIASGSDDRTVQIWDLRLRETINKFMKWDHVALSHDGGWVVTASCHHIQVWRVTETMIGATNKLGFKTDVTSLALPHGSDGSHIVIGCKDRSIQVWNHLTNTIECQMSGHSKKVLSVAFSYDGCRVVSGSWDRTVRIWDCHTGDEVSMYQHSDWVSHVAFSHNSGRVAFGSNKHGVWIWNTSTGQIHSDPRPENISESVCWLYSIAFSHNNSHVIFGQGVWVLVFLLTVTLYISIDWRRKRIKPFYLLKIVA